MRTRTKLSRNGHPPSPAVERLGAQDPGHQPDHRRGQEQPDRHAQLREAGHQPLAVALAPLHRHQDGAAPLATDADALGDPQEGQQDRRCDADGGVAGKQADEERRHAHEDERRHQRGLPAHPVAVVPEDRRADRTGGEPDEQGREGEQDAGERRAAGEEQLREDQRRGGAVEEEVVPLDARADGTGEYRSATVDGGAVCRCACRHEYLPRDCREPSGEPPPPGGASWPRCQAASSLRRRARTCQPETGSQSGRENFSARPAGPSSARRSARRRLG